MATIVSKMTQRNDANG